MQSKLTRRHLQKAYESLKTLVPENTLTANNYSECPVFFPCSVIYGKGERGVDRLLEFVFDAVYHEFAMKILHYQIRMQVLIHVYVMH